MTIYITTPDVPTSHGVPVTVDGVAQVKIGSDESSIRTAAIQFLSRTKEEIEHVAHETLAGHLRAILGTLTVEQLYRDREAFAQKVQERLMDYGIIVSPHPTCITSPEWES